MNTADARCVEADLVKDELAERLDGVRVDVLEEVLRGRPDLVRVKDQVVRRRLHSMTENLWQQIVAIIATAWTPNMMDCKSSFSNGHDGEAMPAGANRR